MCHEVERQTAAGRMTKQAADLGRSAQRILMTSSASTVRAGETPPSSGACRVTRRGPRRRDRDGIIQAEAMAQEVVDAAHCVDSIHSNQSTARGARRSRRAEECEKEAFVWSR